MTLPMLQRIVIIFLASLASVTAAQTDRARDTFPEVYNSEQDEAGRLTPTQALASLHLPDGFTASLFAAEPDVQNPIAVSLDPQGRVWVAENYTYAEREQRFDLNLNDRVIVLEDSDGDGVSDKRTVFTESVQMLTGVVTGQGGVWLMCPPQLLFIPDGDADLIPDGPAEVKLDGFHVARDNYHNFANGLSWGPDGWLYGRCGASCPGEMGVPGTSDQQRVPLRGGMWRFHPQRGTVEALTHGTTNPWGHDWNAVGDQFFINTVNGHLWHAIPGAHFVRPHSLDANPHVYDLIDTHADHWHFDTGQSWTASRAGAANDYGGGHAHVGMMIYQGDAWPAAYRGKLMTVNMHGRRINTDQLEALGSGYVGHHGDDFVLSDDTWFRGMDIVAYPDGNALLVDWSDTGECHDHTGIHRTSGRIFKISYQNSGHTSQRLPIGHPAQLARIQIDGDEWSARRARELLRSEFLSGTDCAEAIIALKAGLSFRGQTVPRLRCLWSLVQLQAADDELLLNLLADPEPQLRKWAVQLIVDQQRIDNSDGSRPTFVGLADFPHLPRLVRMAQLETDAAVRLALASTLQRLGHADRPDLARALLSHAEDADDHNLPLIVWYGLTPLGDEHSQQLIELLPDCHWPTVRRLIARRVADRVESQADAIDGLVSVAVSLPDEAQVDIVAGIAAAMAGRRQVAMPGDWRTLTANLSGRDEPGLTAALQQLDVLFGDGRATEELMQMAADGTQPLEARMTALRSLVAARAPGLQKLCLDLLRQRYLNTIAAEGLAVDANPEMGEQIVKRFRSFAPLDQPRILSLLSARPAWAHALLRAVERGEIRREEITPFHARQIASLQDVELQKLLIEQWGQVRKSPAERTELIERLQAELTPNVLAQGNKANGRQLYEKTCASCHTLFGVGGKLGPDLTGSQRGNLDYLLMNIVDPSAVVTNDFRATVVALTDGRVLTGLVTAQTDSVMTLATQDETYQLSMADIEQAKQSPVSTMPDGLLGQLSAEQIRDLFAYLQSPQQVSLK